MSYFNSTLTCGVGIIFFFEPRSQPTMYRNSSFGTRGLSIEILVDAGWGYEGFTHLLSQHFLQLMPPEIFSKRNALNRTNATSPIQTVNFRLCKVLIVKQRRGFAKTWVIKKNLAASKIKGDFPAFSADFPTIILCTLIISMISKKMFSRAAPKIAPCTAKNALRSAISQTTSNANRRRLTLPRK